MKSKSRVEGMKLRTIFALAGAVFLLASCKSEEKPSGEVRNGVYIQTFEGSYICVKLGKVSDMRVEIPLIITAQGRDELGVAAFIKALGGSFASYLDKSMKEWKAAFKDLPTNQVIENWAGDPEKVIMYIKRDQKALKLLKEAAKERRLELEEAFERVGKLLSGSSPKYSKLYCRATTSFVLENDIKSTRIPSSSLLCVEICRAARYKNNANPKAEINPLG